MARAAAVTAIAVAGLVGVLGPAGPAQAAGAADVVAAASAREPPPTIVLIVTDDQRWDSLWAMPTVRAELMDRGVTFENAFVTNPLCCPSRASYLTGQYSHSTMIYRNVPPYGRADWFRDDSTIATWLDSAGYTTGYFGKYLDGYQTLAVNGYVPPGWDRWVAFVHSEYYGYGLTVDGDVEGHGESAADYSTDVLAGFAQRFVRSNEGPLFVVYAPAAPHAPAIPAPTDLLKLPDLELPMPPSFNEEDVSDKPAWVQALEPRTELQAYQLGSLWGDHHRSLLAVDRGVQGLLDALEETGRLDHSLIVYTSDNGLAFGEHRWDRKEGPYEEIIRIPLVVRYDGVAAPGTIEERLAVNLDFAPTAADAAGIAAPGAEGRSLVPLLEGRDVEWRTDFLIEHLRGANAVDTYCAVRTQRHIYVEYRTGERELYDLVRDPFQLDNVASDPAQAGLVETLETRLGDLCWPPPPGLRTPPANWQDLAALGALLVVGLVARVRARSRAREVPVDGADAERGRPPGSWRRRASGSLSPRPAR